MDVNCYDTDILHLTHISRLPFIGKSLRTKLPGLLGKTTVYCFLKIENYC
ncbi:mCG146870 [Mus musculus]|nr:mCG146870 [Mus musculus]